MYNNTLIIYARINGQMIGYNQAQIYIFDVTTRKITFSYILNRTQFENFDWMSIIDNWVYFLMYATDASFPLKNTTLVKRTLPDLFSTELYFNLTKRNTTFYG